MCYVVKMNNDNISYYTVGNKPKKIKGKQKITLK